MNIPFNDTDSQEPLHNQPEDLGLTYEQALKTAGDQNKYQIRIGLLVGIGMMIAGLQIMGFPFIFKPPDIQCQSKTGRWFDCLPNAESCLLPMRQKPGSHNSIMVTFDLYCSGDQSRITVETSYMIASALGVVALAPIADRYGKRVALMVSYLVTCISLVVASFSPNWIVFLIFVILSGLGRAPFIYYGYQLLVEVSNEHFRSVGVLIMGVAFASGAAATGAIMTLVNYNWQVFYLYFIALPSVFGAVFVYSWADESPMSFFPKRNYEKAREALRRISLVNKKEVPEFQFVEELNRTPKDAQAALDFHDTGKGADQYSFIDLFRYKSLRMSAIGGAYVSFVTYFIFYGQILAVDTLSKDPVTVAILTSAVEGLACIASERFLTKFNRRPTVITSFLLTAVSFLLYSVLSPERLCTLDNHSCYRIMLYVGYVELSVGRFYIAMLMCTTFVYSNELFPTVIRSRGSGLVNFCGRIGSVIPSSVIFICRRLKLNPALLFGLVAIPGCLVAYFMKETKGQPLANHIEEEEKKEMEKQVRVDQLERRIQFDEVTL